MQQNVGNIDRVVRVVIGLGLLSLFFVLEGNARWLGFVGFIPLLTSAVSWCPAYAVFGVDTRETRGNVKAHS